MKATRSTQARPPLAASVAEHLRQIPPEVRPTVQAARRTVKAASAKATEVSYRKTAAGSSRSMWKIARYDVDDVSVVGIGVYPKYATLFFYRGSELDDGSGLLRGSGKQLRYVTLGTPGDAGTPPVKKLIRRAFALARATKQ